MERIPGALNAALAGIVGGAIPANAAWVRPLSVFGWRAPGVAP